MSALILQLSPPLWVQTEKGYGWAILVTDIGADHNKVFTVHLHETGEILDFNIKQIRGCENATYGISRPLPPNIIIKKYIGEPISYMTNNKSYELSREWKKNGLEGPYTSMDTFKVKCDDGEIRSVKYGDFK